MARTVSLKRTLITDHLLVIILLGTSILAATVAVARDTVLDLSGNLIRQSVERTQKEMATFFRPVSKSLSALAALVRNGDLRLADTAGVRRTFASLMVQFPQATSVLFADGEGRETMVLRNAAGWRSRETRPDEWDRQAYWHDWSAVGSPPRSYWESLGYDARTRPWYRLARARLAAGGPGRGVEEAAWTAPYRFYTTGDLGLTATLGFPLEGNGIRVLAADVMLSDLSTFTRGLRVLEEGIVMVLTDDGRMVGLPRHPAFDDEDTAEHAYLAPPEAVAWPLAAAAGEIFRRRDEHRPVRLAGADPVWWGYANPFELAPGSGFWIVALVPESDMLGNVAYLRFIIIGFTLMALVLAGWRVMVLAHRYSRPMESLVQQSERFSRGDLAPRPTVPSRISEIDALRHAHEEMRQGLVSLMKLERDLQLAREIQQGTLPATVPRLTGFEVDAWGLPAEETAGDTYDLAGLRVAADGTVTGGEGGASDRLLALLADATGHGVGPALSATQVRAMFRMAARTGVPLADMARHLNDQLCDDLHEGRFVALWLGELDARSATLRTVSAGQGGLFHYRATSRECERLEAEAPPLGIMRDLGPLQPREIYLERGDLFAVFSDGVYEAEGRDGEPFGLAGVARHLAGHAGQGAAAVNRALLAALRVHTGRRGLGDDCTGVVIRRL